MTKPMQRRDSPVPEPRIGHNGGPPVAAPDDNFDIVADRLTGAGQVAAFWFGHDSWEARKKVYRLVDSGVLPSGRIGGRIIASRRALRRAYLALTEGRPAKRDAAAEL